MTNRDLFHATMHRENGDQLLHIEQGFNIPISQWHDQGLPSNIVEPTFHGITETPDLFDHFNVAQYALCPFDQFMVPALKAEELERTATTRTYRTGNGLTLTERIDGEASLPYEVDFAITCGDDYNRYRDRLMGNINERVTEEHLKIARMAGAQNDHIVTLWTHGPFAFMRDLLGVECTMILPYEEPETVAMMLEDHLQVCMEAAVPIIEAARPDVCFVFEDSCGSTGPFTSPAIFEQLHAPWYRRWKQFLTDMGVPWMWVDSDGDCSPLAPLWQETGADCMQPWEVNAVDMLRSAEELPDMVFMGGIYKHMFEPRHPGQVGRFATTDVRQAIDEELHRVVRPMRERGGYFPSLDHWVFKGVEYDDFLYYCDQLAGQFGKANTSMRWTSQRGIVAEMTEPRFMGSGHRYSICETRQAESLHAFGTQKEAEERSGLRVLKRLSH